MNIEREINEFGTSHLSTYIYISISTEIHIHVDVVNECLLTQVWLFLYDLFTFWSEQTCFCDGHCNTVWVTICWWSAILEVAFHFLDYLAGDADAGAPVGHSCWEIFDAGGFMATREPPLVVISLMGVVCTDVFAVIFAQLLDGLFDVPVVRLRGILLKALLLRRPIMVMYMTVNIC